jgi:hypothetical protein
MSKFAKNRKYLFERTSPVTPNCTKSSALSENSSNVNKINWMQKLIKTSNDYFIDIITKNN